MKQRNMHINTHNIISSSITEVLEVPGNHGGREAVREEFVEEDLFGLNSCEQLTFSLLSHVQGCQPSALKKGHSSLYLVNMVHLLIFNSPPMSSPLKATQEFLVLIENKQKLSVLETLNSSSALIYLQCPTEFTGNQRILPED